MCSPERIPFRLTRMLVNAMEVSGIEGTYRLTCERVMAVLRDNRDSLISMLEAFVHDPLISWRLLGGSAKPVEHRPPAKIRRLCYTFIFPGRGTISRSAMPAEHRPPAWN